MTVVLGAWAQPGWAHWVQGRSVSLELSPRSARVGLSASPVSRTLDERLQRSFAALDTAIQVAAVEGWDSQGAKVVGEHAFERGLAFLASLPAGGDLPHISLDSDGDLHFEWVEGARWRLAIALSERNVLSYAAMFGGSSMYGNEDFAGELPEVIRGALRRIYRSS